MESMHHCIYFASTRRILYRSTVVLGVIHSRSTIWLHSFNVWCVKNLPVVNFTFSFTALCSNEYLESVDDHNGKRLQLQ
jgi:hypothetical protein